MKCCGGFAPQFTVKKNKRSRPEILGPRRKGKRDEVKQELERRSKESRALEKKRNDENDGNRKLMESNRL